MRFPGKRKAQHYFPVKERDQHPFVPPRRLNRSYVVGIDQTLVDIEARVDQDFLDRYGLSSGQSVLIADDVAEQLYQELKQRNLILSEFAGGTIGNTIHNYSVLADDRSVLLGVMSRNIEVGSYGYRYLCNTSSRVDLNYLQPVDGPIGRCFTLINEDGERSFGINGGMINRLSPEGIPQPVISDASALVISVYLMRSHQGETITEATEQALHYAHEADVPVVLTLGTEFLIKEDPAFWQHFIQQHVSVLAMNELEAAALTGEQDPLRAIAAALQWCDLVLLTAGPEGLYTGGYTEQRERRATLHPLRDGSTKAFNRYEFSRPMRRADCIEPMVVFSHIEPFHGGPERITNTNGAGDGALAALLHDMAANVFHRDNVPDSEKHIHRHLCYSSFAQLCKYANRVSFEVLSQHSPRLSRGLPDKEDSLEEDYWDW